MDSADLVTVSALLLYVEDVFPVGRPCGTVLIALDDVCREDTHIPRKIGDCEIVDPIGGDCKEGNTLSIR